MQNEPLGHISYKIRYIKDLLCLNSITFSPGSGNSGYANERGVDWSAGGHGEL